ncbi:mediator complex subunit [Sporothrix eucalyptigena]|uniref:Mediator of RNA polymerase II transcription subunit 14 n=1 Tax=Sporothrix eucalyptigena TaxID=1812306 RepID=A0ABP0BDV9_9PEZI
MAAAIENGALNGDAVHTNHERDGKPDSPKANGVNGVDASGVGTPVSTKVVNGDASSTAAKQASRDGSEAAGAASATRSLRMNDLPDEIQHVTANYVPLGFLLQRLAQKTHNNLQDLIRELARKPVAGSGSSGSGNTAVVAPPPLPPGTEDGSIENIEKKKALLDFARSEHANWVKALVITEWSKKASQISKLIDLENHMFEEELVRYEQAVFTMLNLKRNLNAARVPSPDLKTALHVLSRGTATWMPDLGFLPLPPLNAQEQLKHLDNISTLLSLRLNLDDHDTVPYYFRNDYSIASGRVTFRVPGEFEVDLTLASDDFSQQLWFLDLRFLFSPSPRDLTFSLRKALEDRVNNVLGQEGLPGCYRMLHEYVLTHKINELRRQVRDLVRGRWIDTLRVEQLNRAIAVQYWTLRHGNNSNNGPSSTANNQELRSWFIIGVHSGRDAASVDLPEEQITSRLTLRWFRDNKEVKDLNDEQISELLASIITESEEDDESKEHAVVLSAETILQRVIALHVEHILTGIHAKLAAKPLFAKRLASMRLRISRTDASASFLEIQLTNAGDRIWVRIDPVTGLFSLSPQQSRVVTHSEMRINAAAAGGMLAGGSSGTGGDPIEDGFAMLDNVRNLAAQEDLGRRAKSYGWQVVRNVTPGGGHLVKPDELRQVLNLRDSYQLLWLKRPDWAAPQWHVLAGLSLSGDRWWLVKLAELPPPTVPPAPGQPIPTSGGHRIVIQVKLPMGSSPSDLDDSFFSDLTIFATGVLAQYTDASRLTQQHKKAQATPYTNPYLPPRAKLPAMSIRLSELLAGGATGDGSGMASATSAAAINQAVIPSSANQSLATRRWWANEFVHLLFRGVDTEGNEDDTKENRRRLSVLAEARLTVLDRNKFRLLGNSARSDQDVAFNSRTGQFCLYLRAAVGESVIDTLVRRLRSIERLVGFLDAIRRESRVVHSQTVTLSRLAFSYSVGPGYPLSPEEKENLTTEAAVAAAAAAASCGRWRVTVDLSSSAQVHLQLERGCPHLRVADYLNNVANDPATFLSVPFFLTSTLSLHRALDRMEDAWESVQMRNAGMLGIFPRSLDWIIVRFLIPPDPPGAHARPRLLVLDLRLKTRRGNLLWQIRRVDNSDSPNGPNGANVAADDDLTKLIKRIFESSGPGWKGLLTAAVASPYPPKNPEEAPAAMAASGMTRPNKGSAGSTGIEDVLLQIDEGVRALLSSSNASNVQQQRRAQAMAMAMAQAQQQNNGIPQAQTARMG